MVRGKLLSTGNNGIGENIYLCDKMVKELNMR